MAAGGARPKTRTSNGVIKAPPPTPVTPMSRPTEKLIKTIFGTECIGLKNRAQLVYYGIRHTKVAIDSCSQLVFGVARSVKIRASRNNQRVLACERRPCDLSIQGVIAVIRLQSQ